MYQKVTSKTKLTLINVSAVATALGDQLCSAIIGLHSYTGSDSTSAFASKGKIGAFKIIQNNLRFKDVFKRLGENWDVSEDLEKELEEFTCLLYSAKSKNTSINDLRYQLFCAKKGAIESFQLPPCKDTLKKHIIRANYQAAIWRRSNQNNAAIPSPVGKGWKMETTVDGNTKLCIDWMEGEPAP